MRLAEQTGSFRVGESVVSCRLTASIGKPVFMALESGESRGACLILDQVWQYREKA